MASRAHLKQLDSVAARLHNSLVVGTRGPAHDMVTKWGSRYLGFTQKRYYKMSRGGWKPLAQSTIRAKGSSAILIDHSHLVKGLAKGNKGNLFTFISGGVRVGYQSGVKHPKGKGVTYGQIAAANQKGRGRLPVRRIFVAPDTRTVTGMHKDVSVAIQELGNQAQKIA